LNVTLLGFNTSEIYEEPTGKLIARKAGFDFRNSLNRTRDQYNQYKDVLIRYGVPSYASFDKHFLLVLNKATSIFNNINKLKSLMLLKQHGIRTIPFAIRFQDIPSFPALRRLLNHSRGRDIKLIANSNEFIKGDYYTSLIENYREYRCHIMFDKCVRLTLKTPKPKEEYKENEEFNLLIKSFQRGWKVNDHYKHEIDIEKKIIELSRRAIKALDLDFGAVDVIIENNTFKPYILEVNTAPHLSPYGIEVYVHAFREYLELGNSDIEFKYLRFNEGQFYVPLPIKYRKIVRQEDRKYYD